MRRLKYGFAIILIKYANGMRVLPRDDNDNNIDLRSGGASETNIPRPPKGYRDVLSWGIIYRYIKTLESILSNNCV
jgi:hypothetical protein